MPLLKVLPIEAKERQNEPASQGSARLSEKRRFGSRRGNSVIELAIGLLPFLCLFLGVIEISTMVFIKSVLQNAVRDGVRFAITYQMSYAGTSCSSQTDCVQRVIIANSLGFINNNNKSLVKVRYYNPYKLGTALTAATVGGSRVLCASGDGCSPLDSTPLTSMNQPGNLVEVSIEGYSRDWMAAMKPYPNSATNALPGTGIAMNAASSDVLQGLPTNSLAPPAP